MKIRIKMIALEIDGQRHIYTEWAKFLFPVMSWFPVTIENESDFSYKEWFLGSRRRHMSLPLLDCLVRLKKNVRKDEEGKKQLVIDTLVNRNLKAKFSATSFSRKIIIFENLEIIYQSNFHV